MLQRQVVVFSLSFATWVVLAVSKPTCPWHLQLFLPTKVNLNDNDVNVLSGRHKNLLICPSHRQQGFDIVHNPRKRRRATIHHCFVLNVLESLRLYQTARRGQWRCFSTTNNGDEHERTNDSLLTHPDLVVTFDLDDTLYPIKKVVEESNAVMLEAIQDVVEAIYTTADSTSLAKARQQEPCLARFTFHMKQIREKFRTRSEAISYSELRRLAILEILKEFVNSETCDETALQGYVGRPNGVDLDEKSHVVFDAWLKERQLSAERNLFPQTVDALKLLRNINPSVIIGAITNGRGCPLQMASLRPFFDFTVSGEDEDVFPHRKPSSKIFQVAMERVRSIREEKYGLGNVNLREGKANNDGIFNGTQNVWVHVGDDLTNDVGASAAYGAYSIWMTPKYITAEEKSNAFWSTASPDEMASRRESARLAIEKASCKVSCLSELCEAISVLSKASDSKHAKRNSTETV